ncbi:hypothetical protein Trydic_g8276 [Trypoxylus dichotomus]
MNTYLKNFSLSNCYEIIKKQSPCTECVVRSFEFCALDEKLGFLGEHSFLKISYNEEEQSKDAYFFCKTMCTTESQRNFAIQTGAFYKECEFYKNLISIFLNNGIHIVKECIPNCYLISDMNYLIFEDLKSKGYRTVTQRESMSLECVKVFLEALAKLHCSGFIFEEKMKQKTRKSYVLSEEHPMLFKEGFYTNLGMSLDLIEATKKGVKAQIDLFEDPSQLDLDLFKELACKTLDEFQEIVKPSTVFRNSICHGDLWSTNIMFKFDNGQPTHCYIVDYQFCRYGPPGQDFMAFIYLSTDRKFRQRHMENMRNYYYRKINEILTKENLSIRKLLPYAEFLESCDYYKLFAIAQSISHFQLIMASPEVFSSLFLEAGALGRALFEDKSLLVVPICDRDEVYRRRIMETTVDLKEAFIGNGLLKYY